MFDAVRNAWRLPDLRRKVLFTLFILVVYRVASHIANPGFAARDAVRSVILPTTRPAGAARRARMGSRRWWLLALFPALLAVYAGRLSDRKGPHLPMLGGSAGAVAGMLIPFAVPTMPAQDAGSGYLSSSYAPFSLGSDPANGGFRVQDLSLPANVTNDRVTARKNMLDAGNAHFAGKERSDNLDAMDTFYQRAYGLISSEKAREAFEKKPDWVTFTSSSTVTNLIAALGGEEAAKESLHGVRIASIGPITTATAKKLGLHVDVEAQPHTIEGLVEAITNA